jgi:1-acyl-sn-glycerol-3-phosphate acyltransferase
MIPDHPAAKLLVAWFYTIYMSQNAMRAKALGGSDARIREYVQEWSRGLRRHLGVEVRAFGMESVDWSRTYVIMANHASYLDVLALYSTLPRIVGFVAKKELYKIPFFNGVMDAVGCVPVDRSKHRQAVDALREAAEAVRAGTTIAIFPEGTRSRGDRIQPLKKGPFHLVQMAQVEVLPIGIRGAGSLMPRENTGIRSGLMEVHVGTPLPPPPPGDAEARAALTTRVRAELARLAGVPTVD